MYFKLLEITFLSVLKKRNANVIQFAYVLHVHV